MSRRVKSMRQLENYRAHKPGQRQAIRQPLYDHASYAAAGQTSLLFFQTPKGQGTTSHTGATGSKTVHDTNMEAAGMLPQGKNFLLEAIEIYLYPGVLPGLLKTALAESEFANDVYTLAKSGALELFIGSKPYQRVASLDKFPPSRRLEIAAAHSLERHQAAAANAEDQVSTEYASITGRPFVMDPPILLESNENFHVELTWPVAVALPSGQAARIGVYLDGLLIRNQQ